ncbi:MAG: four helix bundle protein [Bacteroidetes bacterium]|nr:four helix bundle protein [Bacteroidota bacterium]
MHRFKELDVWKTSVELVKTIYEMTAKYPRTELFGLISQIRRSAVSIPSNIAEGAGKNTKNDFNKYISIALGSCNELETQLYISKELKYITWEDYKEVERKTHRIQNMLFGLQKSLRNT